MIEARVLKRTYPIREPEARTNPTVPERPLKVERRGSKKTNKKPRKKTFGSWDRTKTHPISELEARMDPAVLAAARKMAQREILNVRLAILREKYGIKQNEIANFTQTAVSKIENRQDIRISTLIDYLDSLGMGLEIIARPKNSKKREVLLKI